MIVLLFLFIYLFNLLAMFVLSSTGKVCLFNFDYRSLF